jgi:hypothetical protein
LHHIFFTGRDLPLLKRVKSFCDKNEIKVSNMDLLGLEILEGHVHVEGKKKVTQMHLYHIEIFIIAIDAIL